MINYCRCSALSVLLGIIWSSSAVLAQSPTNGLQFELVAAGIQNPTQVTNARDGSGRLFAVSQLGTIRVLAGTTFLEEPFLDISDQVICCSKDGLLGVAFHPDYATDGRFFVRYTDLDSNNILSSFRVSEDNPDRADPDSEEIILLVPQPSPATTPGSCTLDQTACSTWGWETVALFKPKPRISAASTARSFALILTVLAVTRSHQTTLS
jgi:hypothetical protein